VVASKINSQHADSNVINDSRIDTQSPMAIDKHKRATAGRRERKNSIGKAGFCSTSPTQPTLCSSVLGLDIRPPPQQQQQKRRSCSLCLPCLSHPVSRRQLNNTYIHVHTRMPACFVHTRTSCTCMYHARSDHLARLSVRYDTIHVQVRHQNNDPVPQLGQSW
jgi:hypothetical protein